MESWPGPSIFKLCSVAMGTIVSVEYCIECQYLCHITKVYKYIIKDVENQEALVFQLIKVGLLKHVSFIL